nr:hypothetical protein [Thermomonospora curvata]
MFGRHLNGHSDFVRSVASGWINGIPIATSGGEDRGVRVWDLPSRQPLGRPLTGRIQEIRSVAFGEIGGALIAISGGDDGIVRVWSLRSPWSAPHP